MTKMILAMVLYSTTFFWMNVIAQEQLKCDSPEHRQLNFWIGDWEVTDHLFDPVEKK